MANLSQIKRERMIEFLRQLKEEHNDDASLIALNEIENTLVSKKYGLVWEQHDEQVDAMMRENVPVFTEVAEREIREKNSNEFDFLLEGDNLHSLKLLEKTHRNRIDVIYIDPPYNMGGDFIYNDSYIVKEDGYRHSKWCSFMAERLTIARSLLSDIGAIFISIDDNECAQLKLLCDEIFGESCFVADVSWQRTYSIRNDSKGIPIECEHLLIYSKREKWQPHKLERTEKMDAAYKNPDGDRCDWMSGSPIASDARTHQGMVYAIQHPFTGEMIYPNNTAHWRYGQSQMLEYMNGWCKYELADLHDDEKRAEICGVSVDEIKKDVMGIVLADEFEEARKQAQKVYDEGPWPRFYFTNGGQGGIRRKVYADSVDGRIVTNNWMYDEVGHTDEAKKELKNIFEGAIPFDTPKPVRLIKRILEIASNKDSIILDFFAGSGTTGQAVIEQNKVDGGYRKYILCTNNENGICENITYQRIQKVIRGYAFKGKKEDVLFEKNITLKDLSKIDVVLDKANKVKEEKESKYKKVVISFKDGILKVIGEKDTTDGVEGIASNLKYYKTTFIPKVLDDENYSVSDALLKYIKEMVQLENGISIDNCEYVIVLTDEDADKLEQNKEVLERCKGIYIASDVFLTSLQEKLFSKIAIKQIPDYYFEDELREVHEIW